MEEFTKFHGDEVARHWQRLVVLAQVAEQLNVFSTPTPLRILEDGRSIAYEPLPPGHMLVTVLLQTILPSESRKKFARGIIPKVGEALATLHNEKKPSSWPWIRPAWRTEQYVGSSIVRAAEGVLAESPAATYHGDFGHGNVWIADNQRIWFYDPIPSPFSLDPDAVNTSVYFDIGHMVACLWAVYPLRMYPFLWALDRANWISLLLDGYERHAGVLLNHDTVKLVAAEILLGFAQYTYDRAAFPKAQIFRHLIQYHSVRLLHASI
jgi:hypothetical protein